MTLLGGKLGEGGGEKVPGARSFLVEINTTQYHTHYTTHTIPHTQQHIQYHTHNTITHTQYQYHNTKNTTQHIQIQPIFGLPPLS